MSFLPLNIQTTQHILIPHCRQTNPDRTLVRYREAASQAAAATVPGGAVSGQGGQNGQGNGQPPVGAGGSMLAVPSVLSLLAVVGGLLLL